MEELPKDCLSAILSKTSPKDACRLSAVSSAFRSAAESETLWEKFLPSNHRDIIARLVAPAKFSTKKDLFLRLCSPHLIDNGKKSFKLERATGRTSYILSARELSITWSNDPMYWTWKPMPKSRFEEAAELRTIHWLEIEGRIRTNDLSPNTLYAAYLIMKVSSRAYGLDLMPTETSIEIRGWALCAEQAYLHIPEGRGQDVECRYHRNMTEMAREKVEEGEVRVPSEREDGWIEIQLGEFFSGETNEEVKMRLKEVKGYQLKGGLIIEGIEIRPG